MYSQIYLDAPNIGKAEKESLNKAIDSGYVSTAGPFVPRFEEEFAKYLGVQKAVATQSGTAAIHIVLHQLGIGEGDEVIVPALTFVATVNPIIYVGAKPVFVDVDRYTWNIDPNEIEKAVTKKTKAIIPVHLYGNPCDMDRIMNIAKKHKLKVIEDATESLGVRYSSIFTGTIGHFGCFSFNGNKIITTGGGGMVVSNINGAMERIKFLINQARDEAKGYYHPEIGFNYRMTNIEAALGLAQMKKLGKFLSKKNRFSQIYREGLKDIGFISFQKEYKYADARYWLTSIIFEKDVDITFLQKMLNKNRIPTRRIFMPVTEFPPYRIYKQGDYENSYYIYERGLCLPSSVLNCQDDVYYVCKNIKDFFRKKGEC